MSILHHMDFDDVIEYEVQLFIVIITTQLM